MALPTLDSVFASAADLPRRQMLAQWLVNIQYSGSVADYATLPEYYLWAKIAVAAGAPRGEADYISLPKNYAWSDIYNAVAGLIPPSSVLVSGAGSGVVNGIYTETGENNGKKYYNQSGFSVIDQLAISWSGVEWIIHDDIGDGFYASTDDVEFPWQVTSWAATNGEEPTPTVAEIPQPSPNHTDWSEKQALGHIAAAYRGDTANPANLATYIDWPWRYQVASIITNTAVDTDAQTFITTSGATDIEGIDQFVKGVKNLGLYNSMVCWPLRSTQNAGTGTTAYSLGGLGTFNGTLVNGPAWANDGIDFDGVDDHITTTFTQGATQVFCGMVGDMPTSGAKGNFYGGTNNQVPSHTIYWMNPRTTFGGEYRYGIPSTGNLTVADNTTSGVHMWSAIGGTVPTKGYRSTTLLGTGGIGPTPDPSVLQSGLILGRVAGGYQGTAAFAFIIHAAPASPDAFYTLYKQTLGAGLSLP
jgi:hypothetical protein